MPVLKQTLARPAMKEAVVLVVMVELLVEVRLCTLLERSRLGKGCDIPRQVTVIGLGGAAQAMEPAMMTRYAVIPTEAPPPETLPGHSRRPLMVAIVA